MGSVHGVRPSYRAVNRSSARSERKYSFQPTNEENVFST